MCQCFPQFTQEGRQLATSALRIFRAKLSGAKHLVPVGGCSGVASSTVVSEGALFGGITVFIRKFLTRVFAVKPLKSCLAR